MKLGIVGYRNYNNYEEFKQVVNYIIDLYQQPEAIVSGGHTDKYGNTKPGTDTLAWIYANENNIPIIEHDALWEVYGRAAGPIRNKLIVNDSSVLIAFVSPTSRGTLNSIKLAQEQNIIVHMILID